MEQNRDDIIKAAILAAAEKLFQKWGLKKTTMEDIAKAAGKGKSTLYYYYKSKEEIYYIVSAKSIESIIKASRDKIEGEPTAEKKLRTYLTTCVNEIKKFSTINDIVRGEVMDNIPMMEKIRAKFIDEEKILISEILTLGIENKEFKKYSKDEIDAVSYSILSSIRTLLTDFYTNKEFVMDIDSAATVLDIMFNGIKR